MFSFVHLLSHTGISQRSTGPGTLPSTSLQIQAHTYIRDRTAREGGTSEQQQY